MIQIYFLRRIAVITFLLFSLFTISQSYSFGQKEDSLEKWVQRYLLAGDISGAMEMLNEYIGELIGVKGKEPALAEAYYLLAKTCYRAGFNKKVEENLYKAYTVFPAYDREEFNPGFRKFALKIKIQTLEDKKKGINRAFSEIEKDKITYIEKLGKKKKKKKNKFPWPVLIGSVILLTVVIVLVSGEDSSRPVIHYD